MVVKSLGGGGTKIFEGSFIRKRTAPWKKLEFFGGSQNMLRYREGQGDQEVQKKHIWKIFYRGDPEIGTPGTPRRVPWDQNFFFEKFSLKKLFGYM